MSPPRKWTVSVEEARTLLVRVLPEASLEELASLRCDQLLPTHFGLSMLVRNEFGLWSGNTVLTPDCARIAGKASLHPDDVSMVILERLWEALQDRRASAKAH
jgi:hypothetical protein